MGYRYLWFLILLCGLIVWPGSVILAQSHRVVYPVKQNHLWGFISKRGEMLVPPRYDAIGEPVKLLVTSLEQEEEEDSAYRLVEVGGKLGIIDHGLREILPCTYDFILPVSSEQFLVKQTAGYTVVDTSGRSLSEQYYQQLEFAGTTADGVCLYALKVEGKTGIINANGDTLLPCNFTKIQLLEWRSDLFLTRTSAKSNSLWTLSMRKGNLITNKVQAAKAPHPGLLLLIESDSKEDKYHAYDANGQLIPALDTMTFVGGKYLSPELVRLDQKHWNPKTKKTEYKQFLFNVRQGQVLCPGYLNFRYLDGQYCVGISRRPAPRRGSGMIELETILTPQGESRDSSSWYRVIKVWSGTTKKYRVRSQFGWGVIDQNGKEIVPQEYDKIGPIEEGLAIMERNQLQGMMTATGRPVVPTEFSRIIRRDKRLDLENRKGSTIMYVDDSLNVVSISEYKRMRALHIGAPPSSLRIASRAKWSSLITETNADSSSTTNTPVEDLERVRLARWFNQNPITQDTSLHRVPRPEAEQIGLNQLFLQMHDAPVLSNKYFMRFYSHQEMHPSAALQRLAGRPFCVKPQRLFADESGHLYPDPVLGFRTIDFLSDWHVAPALAMDGRFFLMGKDGEPLRDKDNRITYFTFVGEANNGLLRVCIGGVLDLVDPNENNRERLPSFKQLLFPFGMRLPCGTLKDYGPQLTVRSTPRDSARWGLIDTLGQWVIPPVYDYLEENVDSQMVARRGTHYGVIDITEDTIVPFEYLAIRDYQNYWRVNSLPIGDLYFNWRGYQIMDADTEDAREFREGYCARQANGRWHFIDEIGEKIGDKDFSDVRPFGEGLAAVRLDSTHWAFIDTSGQISKNLPAKPYHDLGYFVDDRCWFRRGSNYGFLDKNMQEVIPPIYKYVKDFAHGRAIVGLRGGAAVIDTAGHYLIPPGQYSEFKSRNDEGLFVATVANRGQFLVDTLGRRLHKEGYDQIELVGEAPYAAKFGRLWGYLNPQGKAVIPPKYRMARPFSDGRAAVKPPRAGDRWVFIDTQGRQISHRSYAAIEDFSHGLALVRDQNNPARLLQANGTERKFDNANILFTDGSLVGCSTIKKEFFTDQQGNRVFANDFDKIEPFNGAETTSVILHGRKGIVDRRGMLLVACKYYKFEARDDGTYLVGPPAFGIYDREGKLVVPSEFDHLLLLEGEIFRVERGEKVGYLKTDGTEVWPLQN